MRGDLQVRFREKLRVRFLWLTRLEGHGRRRPCLLKNGNTVSFVFDFPKTEQPKSRTDKSIIGPCQNHNKVLVEAYNYVKNKYGISTNDPNLIANKDFWKDVGVRMLQIDPDVGKVPLPNVADVYNIFRSGQNLVTLWKSRLIQNFF